uniref:Uncharacterized protein n=1 Tax=Oryza meridionalis TaxID=40149 RepID=A0A0E0CTU2_9ORYZ
MIPHAALSCCWWCYTENSGSAIYGRAPWGWARWPSATSPSGSKAAAIASTDDLDSPQPVNLAVGVLSASSCHHLYCTFDSGSSLPPSAGRRPDASLLPPDAAWIGPWAARRGRARLGIERRRERKEEERGREGRGIRG